MFIFYSHLIDARERHFTAQSLKMLFEDLSLYYMSIKYLKIPKKVWKQMITFRIFFFFFFDFFPRFTSWSFSIHDGQVSACIYF